MVMDRIDDDIRPELRTILAHAPAFGFEPPGGRGDLKRACGHARVPVSFGVETGEMPPDDFIGQIALDPFRPGIPVGDGAVGVAPQYVVPAVAVEVADLGDGPVGPDAGDEGAAVGREAPFALFQFAEGGLDLLGTLFDPLFERGVELAQFPFGDGAGGDFPLRLVVEA